MAEEKDTMIRALNRIMDMDDRILEKEEDHRNALMYGAQASTELREWKEYAIELEKAMAILDTGVFQLLFAAHKDKVFKLATNTELKDLVTKTKLHEELLKLDAIHKQAVKQKPQSPTEKKLEREGKWVRESHGSGKATVSGLNVGTVEVELPGQV
jgi:hypothetical protein